MTARTLTLCTFLAALPLATSCQTVSETGRSQFVLFPESQLVSLGATAYADETSKYPVITGTAQARMLDRVGQRIATASGRDFEWEFKLLDAPEVVNAFCLPGGKIAVYTGILPFTQNEAGLAAVVGHEVAHATAQHGNERMSQGAVAEVGMSVVQAVLDGTTEMDPSTQGAVMGALGLGVQYGALMPYGREHESEADEIGLRFLIRAGYDPNEAPRLWDRMAEAAPSRPPEFLSTHPDPANRAQRLRELIPVIQAEESSQQP